MKDGRKKSIKRIVSILIVFLLIGGVGAGVYLKIADVQAKRNVMKPVEENYTKREFKILEIVPSHDGNENEEIGYFVADEGRQQDYLKVSAAKSLGGTGGGSPDLESLEKMRDYGLIKYEGIDSGAMAGINYASSADIISENPVFNLFAVFVKEKRQMQGYHPMPNQYIVGDYKMNTSVSGRYNLLDGYEIRDDGLIWKVEAGDAVVSGNDISDENTVSGNDGFWYHYTKVEPNTSGPKELPEGVEEVDSDPYDGNLDFVPNNEGYYWGLTEETYYYLVPQEVNEAFYYNGGWFKEFVLGDKTLNQNVKIDTKVANKVTAGDMAKYDLIYVSGTKQAYAAAGTDLSEDALLALYNRTVDGPYQAVIMDHALFENSNQPMNIEKLALLLWQEYQKEEIKESNGFTMAGDKVTGLPATSSTTWDMLGGTLKTGGGMGNFVAGSTYVYNHRMSYFKSSKVYIDANDFFGNGDFTSSYTPAVISAGLEPVEYAIQMNNINHEDSKMGTAITPATVIQYILSYDGTEAALVKSKLKILEVQPVRAFLYNENWGSEEYFDCKKEFQKNRDDFICRYIGGNFVNANGEKEQAINQQYVDFTSMTVEEFIGRNEDLNETYDMIYLGSNYEYTYNNAQRNFYYEKEAMTYSLKDGKGKFPVPSFNDPNMTGMVYYNIGDLYNIGSKAHDHMAGYLVTEGVNDTKAEARFSGRDLTETKKQQLLDYLQTGYPVITAGDLMRTRSNLEKWPAFGYAMFAGGETAPLNKISFSGQKLTIYGDTHTNGGFDASGGGVTIDGSLNSINDFIQGSINASEGTNTGVPPIAMPSLTDDEEFVNDIKETATIVGNEVYGNETLQIDNNLYSTGTLTFKDTKFQGEGVIYAEGDIIFEYSEDYIMDENTRLFICSANGKVTIDAAPGKWEVRSTLNATIFAPKGHVYLWNLYELNINGRILSQSIEAALHFLTLRMGDDDLGMIEKPESQRSINPTRVSNETKDKITPGEGGRDFDHGRIDNSSKMYEFFEEAVYQYESPNFFSESDVEKGFIKRDTITEYLNASKLYLNLTEKPVEYSYSTKEVNGVRDVIDSSTVSALRPDANGRYFLEYEFSIDNPATIGSNTDTYEVHLYIDVNADGKFSEQEELYDVTITNAATGVEIPSRQGMYGKEYSLSKNVAYKMRRQLPEDYSGVLPWCLRVQMGGNPNIRVSEIGYTMVPSTDKININILQINHNSNSTLNLEHVINNNTGYFGVYLNNLDMYDVSVTTVTQSQYVNDFIRNPSTENPLNAYDMLILGFGDYFTDFLAIDAAYGKRAAESIVDFINVGKPVLLTHDFIMFDTTFEHSKMLREIMGMDRYGVTTDVANSALKAGKQYTRSGDSAIVNAIESTGKRVAYLPGSDKEILVQHTHGFSNTLMVRYTSPQALGKNYINPPRNMEWSWNLAQNYMINSINKGQITTYPYMLPNSFSVASTHDQYFQLDMETDADEDGESDVVVWYTLGRSTNIPNENIGSINDKSVYNLTPNNTNSNFYIYNKGNITYTGAGHSSLGGSDQYEAQLFVNTMIAAYKAGIKAPTIYTFEGPQEDSQRIDDLVIPYDAHVGKNASAGNSQSSIIKDPENTAVGEDEGYMHPFVNSGPTATKLYFQVIDTNLLKGTKNISSEFFIIVDEEAGGSTTGTEEITMPDGRTVYARKINPAIYTSDFTSEVSKDNLQSGVKYGMYLPLSELNTSGEINLLISAQTKVTNISVTGKEIVTESPMAYKNFGVIKMDLLRLD